MALRSPCTSFNQPDESHFLLRIKNSHKISLMVFDSQASLKNQKVALLVVLRGAFLGGIGTLVFRESWHFLRIKYIDSSSNLKEFYLYHFFIFINFFEKIEG